MTRPPLFEQYEVLSFDCYGTLIDWERGIADALRRWSTSVGLDLDDEQLIAAHAAHETHVQQERPGDVYPAILAETLRRIGADLGAAVTVDDATAYGDSVGDWPAFPDSAAALTALQQRFRLAILSNVDRTSFARSNARLGVEFDLIVTAQDVGSYKPNPANFAALLAALADIAATRADLLHVAESRYHDLEPAQQLGLESVWINRRVGKQGSGATAAPRGPIEPAVQFGSMAEFAEAALG